MKYICLTMLLVSAIQWCEYMNTYIYCKAAAAAAKSLQSCLTLWDPIDGSPPCSPVPGILQARILEWVAISFSNAWKWKVKVKSLSRVRLPATPSTAAYQAPPSMGFSSYMYTYISSFLSLPPILPSHPFRSSQHQAELPVLYGSFPLVIYFIHQFSHFSCVRLCATP